MTTCYEDLERIKDICARLCFEYFLKEKEIKSKEPQIGNEKYSADKWQKWHESSSIELKKIWDEYYYPRVFVKAFNDCEFINCEKYAEKLAEKGIIKF